MRDKCKAGVALYRKSLNDLPSEAVGAVMTILMKFGFALSKKCRDTGVTRYYHRKAPEIIACFDPRGGTKNLGCGMPCIRIYRKMRPNAVFDETRRVQELSSFINIETINLLYIDDNSIKNIIADAREFFIDFNHRIIGG
jgi:hypothetical protein